ncbi:MAG: AAA family ATPase [Planctomycetaceae bacterium]|nr:AAA family ATPase [Planctomycetaceae bacterium]
MTDVKQKIRYLRECYSSDSSGIEILNVFSRSVEHRIFIEGGNELAFEGDHQIPLDKDAGSAAHEAAIVYEREKELIYASVFIAGKNPETAEKTVSPLVLFPAKIEKISDIPFLSFDATNFRINYGLIKRIIVDDEKGSLLHEQIFEAVADGLFRPEGVAAIVDSFKSFASNIDTSQMIFFPHAIASTDLRKQAVNKDLKLLPAGCVALIRRSIERRGILEELSTMSEANKFSRPICELMSVTGPNDCTRETKTKLEKIPAVLSVPQSNILKSCAQNPVTLVIGPPGTGKSYTIACMALEHMARGKSVLIASRKDHAVDVIGQKIETLSGDKSSVIRGGRKKYLSELKTRLQAILSGMRGRKKAATLQGYGEQQITELTRSIESIESNLKKSESVFNKRSEQEKEYASIQKKLSEGGFQLISKIRLFLLQRRINSRKESFGVLIKSIEHQIDIRNRDVIKRIGIRKDARVHEVLATNRKTLMDFLKSLRARTGAKQRDLLSKLDIGMILKTFPVWMSKNSDIHDNMPLIPEMFDLAIIDEATQCDIASCLPILQRAKRVAIVGDPKQLRHVSFLARSKQTILASKEGLGAEVADQLDYRSKSILDLAEETITDQQRVQFLDEHYRSRPDIIQFSNRHFYNGSLRIMTQNPELVRFRNIQVIQCNGVREKNGINRNESEKLLKLIRDTVESQSHLESEYLQSIGVTTPFRHQADYLGELILREIPIEAIRKHKILVGTPHSFQGEERDIMCLSFALDKKSSATAFRYMNQPDVFNVMVTRARVQQVIFLSIREGDLNKDSLLASYLLYFRGYYQEPACGRLSQLPDSAHPVYDALNKAGYTVWSSFDVAGMEMDFVIQKKGRTLGIDLIGFPGRFEDAFSLERYKMLKRAGMRIFPLAYSEWGRSQQECLDSILDF